MLDMLVAAFVTLVVVIDPPGVVPMFAALGAGLSAAERRRTAVNATLIAGGILIVFAIGGEVLLRLLGIGLPAFRIAGGILLLLLAIEMVMARHTGLRATTSDEETEVGRRADITVFPLAIPLIAGPGAMTSIVLLMGRAPDLAGKALVLAILVAALAIMLASLLASGPVMRLLGVTGTNVISRVAGIVLAALAVQFVIDGIHAAWSPG
jgi:multiple antibiotic resistance protein